MIDPHREPLIANEAAMPATFVICPDCNADSNVFVEITCGTCGCAGVIAKT
jgi:hypothetical protein